MSASTSTEAGSRDGEDDSRSRTLSSARCGLVQCRKLKCDLKTHRQFAAARDEYWHWQKSGAQRPRLTALRPRLDRGVLDHSVSRIEKQLEDGFPWLPFSHETRSMFLELTHHYFEYQIDRLIQLYSPHLDHQKYRSTMVQHALSNDIFCVCITANAKTDMLMRGHVRVPDRASQIVYATTAHTLRQRLNNFRQTDLDWLLVLVVALVGFDLAFERVDALRGHHDALRQIIVLKGGIHAVGHTLPYILNTDRFLATYLGEYPVVRQTPFIPRFPPSPLRRSSYGAAFDMYRVREHIDPVVLDFCRAQCQLVDLMEFYSISLAPRTTFASDASVAPYFLYLRDHLSCWGTCLHAEYHENRQPQDDAPPVARKPRSKARLNHRPTSVSRCVLLAVLMIDYSVSHSDYYTVKAPFLADQLKKILEQHRDGQWVENANTLLWLLFVLVIVPHHWSGREWAFSKIRHWLDVKYGEHWPEARWVEEQLANMRRFVWARVLEPGYRRACDRLITLR